MHVHILEVSGTILCRLSFINAYYNFRANLRCLVNEFCRSFPILTYLFCATPRNEFRRYRAKKIDNLVEVPNFIS